MLRETQKEKKGKERKGKEGGLKPSNNHITRAESKTRTTENRRPLEISKTVFESRWWHTLNYQLQHQTENSLGFHSQPRCSPAHLNYWNYTVKLQFCFLALQLALSSPYCHNDTSFVLNLIEVVNHISKLWSFGWRIHLLISLILCKMNIMPEHSYVPQMVDRRGSELKASSEIL